MTAPLPPHWWLLNTAKGLTPQQYAEAYAKLAVRQALGRALLAVMDYHDRDTIRAMIEEYK